MNETIVIVSGFFNPLHVGHLDMIEDAKSRGDKVYVVVNSDEHQMFKKGKIINKLEDRMRVVAALRDVDEVVAGIDTEKDGDELPSVKTLSALFAKIREEHPGSKIIFGNGGSDRSKPEEVPEYDICQEYDVEMVFDMGGNSKADSSTRINQELGHEDK